MGKRGAAAGGGAAAAMAAAESTASTVPPHVRQGVVVTLAFFVLMYLFFFAQGTMKRKLRAHYAAQDKKFDRYFSRDRKMLGWDRTAGNMMEQAVPFLSLFWLNVFLSPAGGMPSVYITALGWTYIALRSLYPVLWFAGGGGTAGTKPLIWRVTFPMYAIILTFAVNAAVAVSAQ